jgi:hypothetical protein
MSPPDGAERVRRIIDEAEEVKPEPPRPLYRELPPADPFPIDALGTILRAAARAIHDRVQAPLAICAQSVLAAATLAAQGHADILLPIGSSGQAKPTSDNFITLGDTGERKTACDVEALWPVRKREISLREGYDADLAAYEIKRAAWDKAREKALKDGKGIESALGALGPPPAPPLIPMLTCPEPTYEGMCRLLAAGQPSIGIFSAEGGQFIGGHGMSDEPKLRTAAGMSAVWDGEPIRRVRAGDGITILPGRRVSMHLMVQSAVADIWLRDRLLRDQGLLSRMMMTAPDSAMGSRLWHDEAPETAPAMARYGARLLSILETPLPLAAGKPNELAPRGLPLSDTARRMWIGFVDAIEKRLGPDGELRPISGIANKLPEHAARLAGELTCVRNIDAGEIAGAEMAAGIELAQHYAAEALRLHSGCQVSEKLRMAQRVLNWLLNGWAEPVVSLPDLYQRGPSAIRDGETARRIVEILEEHGWLARIPQGAVVAGTRRRDAWRIIRG